MKNIIDPKNYGINSECRIGLKNRFTNKFEELTIVSKNQVYVIPEKYFENNILNYKFKIQVRKSGNTWKDKVNYFNLLDLNDLWTNKVKYSDADILIIIKFYYENEDKWNLSSVKYAFNQVIKHIENSNLKNIDNLYQYFNIVDNMENEVPEFWGNINVYLKYLIRLKRKVLELKLNQTTYIEHQMENDINKLFKEFLIEEINHLKKKELKFADFLAGKYYSFLGMRSEAADLFKNFLTFESSRLHDFDISKGSTTYFGMEETTGRQLIENPIMLSSKLKVTSKTTIVMSLDVEFFRKFSLKIFANIIALKRYQVHLHIIGEYNVVVDTINQAKKLFKDMKNFYSASSNVLNPTYSTETCPDYVIHKPTFYACSRFLHAEFFLDEFKTNLLILDADYTIFDDFKVFLNKINKLDVGMSIRTTMSSMSPWTRNMAGSVFLKNNGNSRGYIKYVYDYINAGLTLENSWILDQNALCYGMEKVLKENKNVNIQNIPYDIKPFGQTGIRNYMEERYIN